MKRVLFIDAPWFSQAFRESLTEEGYYVRSFDPVSDRRLQKTASLLREKWHLVILSPYHYDTSEFETLNTMLARANVKVLKLTTVGDNIVRCDEEIQLPVTIKDFVRIVAKLVK